jgi:hypothetical protein
MKYLKKYNESKLPLINSMSSDDLEEKLRVNSIEDILKSLVDKDLLEKYSDY